MEPFFGAFAASFDFVGGGGVRGVGVGAFDCVVAFFEQAEVGVHVHCVSVVGGGSEVLFVVFDVPYLGAAHLVPYLDGHLLGRDRVDVFIGVLEGLRKVCDLFRTDRDERVGFFEILLECLLLRCGLILLLSLSVVVGGGGVGYFVSPEVVDRELHVLLVRAI